MFRHIATSVKLKLLHHHQQMYITLGLSQSAVTCFKVGAKMAKKMYKQTRGGM